MSAPLRAVVVIDAAVITPRGAVEVGLDDARARAAVAVVAVAIVAPLVTVRMTDDKAVTALGRTHIGAGCVDALGNVVARALGRVLLAYSAGLSCILSKGTVFDAFVNVVAKVRQRLVRAHKAAAACACLAGRGPGDIGARVRWARLTLGVVKPPPLLVRAYGALFTASRLGCTVIHETVPWGAAQKLRALVIRRTLVLLEGARSTILARQAFRGSELARRAWRLIATRRGAEARLLARRTWGAPGIPIACGILEGVLGTQLALAVGAITLEYASVAVGAGRAGRAAL